MCVCEEWTLNAFQLQYGAQPCTCLHLAGDLHPSCCRHCASVCVCRPRPPHSPTPRVHTHARAFVCVCARPCMSYSDRDTRGRRLSCGICLFLVRYSEYVTQITILLSVPPFIFLIRIILNFARFVAPSPPPLPVPSLHHLRGVGFFDGRNINMIRRCQ